MQLTNSFTVPASLEDSWHLLNDVQRITPCMPGATLDTFAGDDFTGRVKLKIGAIQLTYRGTGRFLERDEGRHRLVMEASGKDTRGAGSASATVTATLTGDGDRTTVSVVTDLDITGKPAQFGRGILHEVGGRIIGQFAAGLEQEITAPVTTAAGDAGAGTAAGQPAAPPVRREAEAIDLLAAAGVPRWTPAAGVALASLVLVVLLFRRRR
jgi:carbon monoxide dehydrogenase subunit G